MDIYHYDQISGEYLGKTTADESPLEPGEWLVPANASKTAPPTTKGNEVAVMGAAGWSVKPDYRGTVYWLADGSMHEIDAIGDEPPADALFQEPPPSVSDYAASKKAAINASCDAVLASIKDSYPDGEVETWDKQEAEARAYLADNAALAPFLSGLAEARGISVADLAARVIAKADAFVLISSAAIGQRQALEDEVTSIVARNQLTPTDPNYDTDYLDDTAARSAIDAVALVT